jgi:carbon storage regulator
MLILSRKPGQQICIGKDIIVSVKQVKSGRVKVAIDAPEQLVIRRGELQAELPAASLTVADKAAHR